MWRVACTCNLSRRTASWRPAWAKEQDPVLKKKKKNVAGHQWLTPIILVTQEAEIGRIEA
jgi:hypothetical protein